MQHRGRLAVLVAFALMPLSALAKGSQPTALPARLEPYFPVPVSLEPAVDFWKNVYARYNSRQVVLHDPIHMDVVYVALDFSGVFDAASSPGEAERAATAALDCERERIAGVLRAMAARIEANEDMEFSSMTAEQRRFYSAFRATSSWSELNPTANAELLRDAADRIRAQRGLRDEFLRGIWDAAPYMPYMEKKFVDRGLPRELTRLVFVESMFNLKARSHVGAAGPFQFMRYTGRDYMRIDTVVDERYDPIRASEAAARLLDHNHQSLGSWPLAITAYNHGVRGMKRAVSQTGSEDLGVIAFNYTSRSFGFASRNFYAEFLAALTVYENRASYFSGHAELQTRPPLLFDQVVLPDYVPLDALLEDTNLTKDEFRLYNPAFTRYVYEGQKYVEKGYPLRLPRGKGKIFAGLYAKIPADSRFSSQRRDAIHIVQRGDTLSGIARRHGVRVSSLIAWNNLHSRHRIYPGQRLRIVPGGGRSATPSKVDPPKVKVVDVVRLPGDDQKPADALAAALASESPSTDPMPADEAAEKASGQVAAAAPAAEPADDETSEPEPEPTWTYPPRSALVQCLPPAAALRTVRWHCDMRQNLAPREY